MNYKQGFTIVEEDSKITFLEYHYSQTSIYIFMNTNDLEQFVFLITFLRRSKDLILHLSILKVISSASFLCFSEQETVASLLNTGMFNDWTQTYVVNVKAFVTIKQKHLYRLE